MVKSETGEKVSAEEARALAAAYVLGRAAGLARPDGPLAGFVRGLDPDGRFERLAEAMRANAAGRRAETNAALDRIALADPGAARDLGRARDTLRKLTTR